MVAEPPQPKVKLRMPAKSPEPPKITLKFGGTKPSIAGGVSVDNEALRRQQDLVNAGMNGGASIRPGPKGPQVPNGIPPLPKPSQEPTRSASAEKPALNGVKSETSVGQSPALAAVQMNTNRNGSLEARQSPNPSMMPPPMANLTTRLPSGSPHPQSYAASSQYNPPTTTNYSSTSQFDSSRRQAGKGTSLSPFSPQANQVSLANNNALFRTPPNKPLPLNSPRPENPPPLPPRRPALPKIHSPEPQHLPTFYPLLPPALSHPLSAYPQPSAQSFPDCQ